MKFRSGYDSVTQTVAKNKHSDINKDLLNKITTFADTIGSNLYYALDSAGYYSVKIEPKVLKKMDKGISEKNIKEVTKLVNGGLNAIDQRIKSANIIAKFMRKKGCKI